jgi:hypothetical protein
MLPTDNTELLDPIDKIDPVERHDRYDCVDTFLAIRRCASRPT